jgi:hypothetical protein
LKRDSSLLNVCVRWVIDANLSMEKALLRTLNKQVFF